MLRFVGVPSFPNKCYPCLQLEALAIEKGIDCRQGYTVRKMGLILRSIERKLKMQFSMDHKFMHLPLRRYDHMT